MEIKNKVIILISPESWGKIFLSKHNYALALARRGNKVYYLNPIENNLKRGEIQVRPSGIDPNLRIIRYEPFFPVKLKFHVRWLFEWLNRIQIRKILRKIGDPVDIVWDFTCSYHYQHLGEFGAALTIFHPVDRLSHDTAHKKADIVFSVSEEILQQYTRTGVPKVLINHGLAEVYAQAAARTDFTRKTGRPLKIGYIGNLLIPSLDRQSLQAIVEKYPDIEFHFIGPYSSKDNNIDCPTDNETDRDFVSFLQNRKNVVLHGTMSAAEIAERMPEFDAFILCYKMTSNYKTDNSHKILEYLSSGKVVISSMLTYYQDKDIIEMPDGDESFPDLFRRAITDIEEYNNMNRSQRRIEFALNHTYERNIQEIERILHKLTR